MGSGSWRLQRLQMKHQAAAATEPEGYLTQKLARQIAELQAKQAAQPKVIKLRKPMERGKGIGPGKKAPACAAAKLAAIKMHFDRHADGAGAPCQYCGRTMLPLREEVVAHHKTPRSEMRKAGVKDLDAPYRLLIIHRYRCHKKIHGGQQGRPKEQAAADEFRFVETSPINAETGGITRGAP